LPTEYSLSDFICVHDKRTVERYLRHDPDLHLYGIGDLDDFFWPYTVWYARHTDAGSQSIVLLYVGQDPPTLLALSRDTDDMRELLLSVDHLLPSRFYAHLSQGVDRALEGRWSLAPHGCHLKMALHRPGGLRLMDFSEARRLTLEDLPATKALYEESYPENWFDARMVETGQYFGLWKEGRPVSVAGVHVYSEEYGVAALGNITTHPSWRRRGFARQVTGRLCQSLLEKVDTVGLNVKADNRAAVSCYEQLGFETVATYGEYLAEKRS